MEAVASVAQEPAQELEDPSKLDWQCLYDKIIVKRDPAQTVFGDGAAPIHAPDQAIERQNVGTVLKTGEGRWVDGQLLPLTLRPGDRVIFSKLSGHQLRGSDPDVILLREDEVLAYARS